MILMIYILLRKKFIVKLMKFSTRLSILCDRSPVPGAVSRRQLFCSRDVFAKKDLTSLEEDPFIPLVLLYEKTLVDVISPPTIIDAER